MNWLKGKLGSSWCLFCIPCILVVACKKQTDGPDYSDYQKVHVRNKYTILIPPDLYRDKKLNPRSEFVYVDTANTSFIMLHADRIPDLEEDSIQIQLSDYTSFARTAIMQAIEDVRVIAVDSSALNGYPAYIYQMEGKVENIPVYYILAVVRAKYYFFQIAAWTRQDLKNFNGKELYYAVISFRPAQ